MSLVARFLPELILAVAMPSVLAAVEPLCGPVAHIVDGDTFDMADVRIRLWGIDAPEDDQPGGKAATATLARLVAGVALACERKGRDHARIVARCRTAATWPPSWCAAATRWTTGATGAGPTPPPFPQPRGRPG
jgi:endonuclease YncB( thermonuclease family)